jgi:hypothetical protein
MDRMTNETGRLQILEMIEKGVISAAEGVKLINSLQEEHEEQTPPFISEAASTTGKAPPAPEVTVEEPSAETIGSTSPAEFESEIKKWRSWWWIPLTVGIVITVGSGVGMYFAYQHSGFGFWFACLWFPLLLGLVVLTLAATSRTTRWLHVRVHQEPGEWPRTFSISLPLPIRFTAWLLRIFSPHIPEVGKTNLDEVILALNKTSADQPFYVKVDEGDSGEKVEVYIG